MRGTWPLCLTPDAPKGSTRRQYYYFHCDVLFAAVTHDLKKWRLCTTSIHPTSQISLRIARQITFLSLLTTGDIQADAEHHPVHDALVRALTTRRDPADIITAHDPEVDFVGAGDRTGR